MRVVERWGWRFEHALLARGTNGVYQPDKAFRRGAVTGPPELAQHTAIFFDKLDAAWRVLYARRSPTNDLPVMIERPLGRGSIVLAADSYPFSNEAMLRDRQSELIAWFIRPNTRVLFDETHLGTVQDPGVATLARQYRLGGCFLATLLLASLFVWRNAVSFLPPLESTQAGQIQAETGRDSAAGFINLLRRSIPPVDLMTVCLNEWKEHGAWMRRPSAARLQAMQQIIDAENNLDARQRDPVRMYREFCRILAGATPAAPPSSKSSNPS